VAALSVRMVSAESNAHNGSTDLTFAFWWCVNRFAEQRVGCLDPRFTESPVRMDCATKFSRSWLGAARTREGAIAQTGPNIASPLFIHSGRLLRHAVDSRSRRE
jgi:hypothetical protein